MIELKFDTQTVAISTLGAVVDSYQVDDRPILYPRQKIDGSYRGGSHVCLPNFGPDEITDQPQHGYGRVEEWQVISQNASDVTLEHRQDDGQYSGLISRLAYRLSGAGLLMRLELDNASDSGLLVAPGFHPYFALPPQTGEVTVNEVGYRVNQVAGTEWTEIRHSNQVVVRDEKIILTCKQFEIFAIWSAHPDKYICIEPTYAGNAHTGKDGSPLKLNSGGQASFSFLVSVV